ncbi:MAG: molybdopterin molybdenumtransferase MoeA, partial [Oscillospiraceae bacterium]|nr:molybdopterin molybdenumtransferase MoeA [Oscillospiraceae bacterium]
GKIRNSNRYLISAALRELGCKPFYMGRERDDADRIAKLILKCADQFDAVISTGGVSAGDYDLTPRAMELCGTKMLFHGVAMKPGMACAYGMKDSKPICALSGSPAAAITNFHAVAAPTLRKMAGRAPLPEETSLILYDGFKKRSPLTRLLRGRLEFADGRAGIRAASGQGNAVLSSGVGCNVIAVIPAGSGPVAPGTVLKGFLI